MAQTDTLTLTPFKKVTVQEIALLSADNLQNIFVADNNGGITTVSYNGEIGNQNTLNEFAAISSLDASFSFNLLIFYQDLQQCVFANRLLKPISEISLSNDYSLAINASNGDLWLFNEYQSTIEKYSPILQQSVAEVQLSPYLKDEEVTAIKEYNHLLAVTTDQAIHFFSLMGELQHKVDLPEKATSFLAQGCVWIIHKKLLQKKALYKNNTSFFKLGIAAPIKGFVIPENSDLLVLQTEDELLFVQLPTSGIE